ncbi:hypothetical protein C7H79_17340 [Nitrosomonas supralitoralis]|uniref:Uncharacterized protein n=2 Tax=Nitrosomonas supralitoralis TaxID=2116706 RepID=A0A2P7NQK9_9PROT|nr:hypothetical protein C7H79_17340 [Nitrosomonas supralitoralis]
MPGINGIDLQAELNRRNIRLPIIFLTSYGDIPMSVRVIKAGAADFLMKPIAIDKIIERIQIELEKTIKRHESMKAEMQFMQTLNSLSAREMEILPMILAGLSTKEVANKLKISSRTVEIHRTQILKKTCTSSFLELSSQCAAYNLLFKQ